MSLPVKRKDCDYTIYDGYSQKWIKVSSALAIVDKHDLDQLEACLLNTQRTVQAFRELLAYSEWQLSTESQIRCRELVELCHVERERDNARAALEEMTKAATNRGNKMSEPTIGDDNLEFLSDPKQHKETLRLHRLENLRANHAEVRCGDLEQELEKALEQRDRAMFYTRHRAMECAQMQNADAECTCGLTEFRNKVKDETK